VKWNEPPADTSKLWLNKSCEIQLLLACSWSCPSCDQGSQFPQIAWVKRGTMTLAQIHKFIGEMQDKNAYFGRVRLVGGEPSLHPHLLEIVTALRDGLQARGHIAGIELVTNGDHMDRLVKVRPMLSKLRRSGNEEKQKHHIANLVQTPNSLGYAGKPCRSPWHCGISLNRYGYFPCSAGAGVARFMDDVPRWQRLELPTCVKPCNAVRETWPDLVELCGHCYHGLRAEHKIKCGTSDPERNKPGEHIRPQMERWASGEQPQWRVYGK
jgi:hypothetical protein